MLFTDLAVIDGPARITRDGYLVAEARVARANNVQTYSAGELGLADRQPNDLIRVFRPAAEVFATDAMASAAHRPITVGHPRGDVTAENWRRLGVGDIGDTVARDGDFIRVPIKLMDATAVKAAQTTHKEFSLGYSADLDMTPGKFGDAEYDAVMKSIRINHLALVDSARGGSALRIVDERPDSLRDGDRAMPHVLIIDGLQVPNVSDEAKAAIEKLQGQVTDRDGQIGKLTGDLATAKTTIETRDGEIVALKKQVEDAQVTPQRLQELADERAKVIADAQAIAGGAVVVDGKTVAEIRKAAVTARLGDAAKDMADAAIEGAFKALADGGPGTIGRTPPPSGTPLAARDGANVRDLARMSQY